MSDFLLAVNHCSHRNCLIGLLTELVWRHRFNRQFAFYCMRFAFLRNPRVDLAGDDLVVSDFSPKIIQRHLDRDFKASRSVGIRCGQVAAFLHTLAEFGNSSFLNFFTRQRERY